jgi:hypothetical protein
VRLTFCQKNERRTTLVERETLVRAFNPGSTLEPGLNRDKRGLPTAPSGNNCPRPLVPGSLGS